MHVQLFYKYRTGYKLFLINVDIDACDYVRNKFVSKAMDLVWPTVKKHITTDPGQDFTCPFIGRVDFTNVPLNGALVNNTFVPVGDYMLNITSVTRSNEYIWNGRFYVNIPEGKTIKDDQMGR